MSSDNHDVRLYLGPQGLSIGAWDRYEIHLSMLGAGLPWTFSFWRSSTAGSTWAEATSLKAGDQVRLTIDDETVLTGWCEDRWLHADRKDAMLVLSGRDMAAPAMRADASPALNLRNLALSDALTQLFATAGLTVTVSATAADATVSAVHPPRARKTAAARRHAQFDLAHPRIGEKVWQVAERLCRRAGYLLWVSPLPPGVSGSTALVVDRPRYDQANAFAFKRQETGTTVTADSNILEGGIRTRLHDVPTSIVVLASSTRGDAIPSRLRAPVGNAALNDPVATGGTVADPLGMPPCPRYVRSEWARTPAECEQEAARMLADLNAELRRYELTVDGHAQRGVIYDVNRMAGVNDDTAQTHEDMLTVDVVFRGDRQNGQTTSLTLVPRNAITLTPTP